MADKTQSKHSSSRILPLLLLLLVVIAGAGWWYFTTMVQPVTMEVDQGPIPLSRENWSKTLFEQGKYTELRSPIPLPLEAGKAGSPNPFIEPVVEKTR